MTRKELIRQIKNKRSFLCIGLDTDITKIPSFLFDHQDPVFEFNKQIIDSTHDLCVAYKINTAFYERRGVEGWRSLVRTSQIIPNSCLSIADAKRGDIGNTSAMYAKAFFDEASSGMSFDAVTVAPYMGNDSVRPFLSFKNKWVILLALTSNEGSMDFQFLKSGDDHHLFETVIRKAQTWGNADQLMFVVGATRGDAFRNIRKYAPDHILLVPGIGAQGGSVQDVCKYGMNADCGLLVNASRSIIYASNGADFAQKARVEAQKIQAEMAAELDQYGL